MARVSDTAVNLHRPVRCIATEPVSDVVAHGNLVRQVERDIGLGDLVHLGGGLEDETAEHGRLGVQLDERPLDRLVGRERLSKGLALLGVLDRLCDAKLCGSARRRSLTDPVFVDKVRGDHQPVVLLAEDGVLFGDPDVLERDEGMVGWHIERPEVLLDLEAGGVDGDDEAGDSASIAVLARGTSKNEVVGGVAN